MIRRASVSLLVCGFVGALLFTSCSDTGVEGAPGVGGASGGEGPSGGQSGEGGAVSIPPPENVLLGLHCRAESDCGDTGLHCIFSNRDFPGGQGGPSGGLCTADCEKDADCRAFDATAVCATLEEVPIMLGAPPEGARRLCMQGCEFGEPSGTTKCHGQLDMACRPFAPTPTVGCWDPKDVCPEHTFCFRGVCREAACGPRCNSNDDCDALRTCNPDTGLCDELGAPQVPLGHDCPGDKDPTSTVCGSGTCLLAIADGLDQKKMCTQSCTVGTLCGDDGACVWPRFEKYAAGDIGYCVQRCNCDADCRHPLDKCYGWSTPELAAHFQSRGICDTFVEGDETLSSCDAGSAGGAGGEAGSGGSSGGGNSSGNGGEGGR